VTGDRGAGIRAGRQMAHRFVQFGARKWRRGRCEEFEKCESVKVRKCQPNGVLCKD